MSKIIAIGGGEIGRPGIKNETLKIDKRIVKLSGKKNPKLLFVPTASGDAEGYIESVKDHFGKKLGCKIDTLYLIKKKYPRSVLRKLILNSDIIYVGGGNTQKMMAVWRRFGIDKLLLEAYEKGVVMSGLSAGSICWFKFGCSDSRMIGKEKTKVNIIKVRGLNFINALHCPHYDFDKFRPEALKVMMKKTSGVSIALDNCIAIEIVDDKYRFIKSKNTAQAYKIFWSKGKYIKETLEFSNKLFNLKNLLKK